MQNKLIFFAVFVFCFINEIKGLMVNTEGYGKSNNLFTKSPNNLNRTTEESSNSINIFNVSSRGSPELQNHRYRKHSSSFERDTSKQKVHKLLSLFRRNAHHRLKGRSKKAASRFRYKSRKSSGPEKQKHELFSNTLKRATSGLSNSKLLTAIQLRDLGNSTNSTSRQQETPVKVNESKTQSDLANCNCSANKERSPKAVEKKDENKNSGGKVEDNQVKKKDRNIEKKVTIAKSKNGDVDVHEIDQSKKVISITEEKDEHFHLDKNTMASSTTDTDVEPVTDENAESNSEEPESSDESSKELTSTEEEFNEASTSENDIESTSGLAEEQNMSETLDDENSPEGSEEQMTTEREFNEGISENDEKSASESSEKQNISETLDQNAPEPSEEETLTETAKGPKVEVQIKLKGDSPTESKHPNSEEAVSEEALPEEAVSEEAVSEEALSEETLSKDNDNNMMKVLAKMRSLLQRLTKQNILEVITPIEFQSEGVKFDMYLQENSLVLKIVMPLEESDVHEDTESVATKRLKKHGHVVHAHAHEHNFQLPTPKSLDSREGIPDIND